MGEIKSKILFRLYGMEYFEAYRLDSILEIFSDEKQRDLENIANKPKGHERVIEKLIKDGYLVKRYDIYEITSEGLLFYAKGGYTGEYLLHKRSNCTFWISIMSAIIAIISFFISIFH